MNKHKVITGLRLNYGFQIVDQGKVVGVKRDSVNTHVTILHLQKGLSEKVYRNDEEVSVWRV
jgi:hypothetical protein